MSMSKSRRKYSAEFKHDAVRLSQDPAHTVAEVAANLGIDLGVLQRWKAQSKANGSKAFPGHGRPKAGDEVVDKEQIELLGVVVAQFWRTGELPPCRAQDTAEGVQFFRMHDDLREVLESTLSRPVTPPN
jgi:transposase-like protein